MVLSFSCSDIDGNVVHIWRVCHLGHLCFFVNSRLLHSMSTCKTDWFILCVHSLQIASSVLLRLKLLSLLSHVQFASVYILVNILMILADLMMVF